MKRFLLVTAILTASVAASGQTGGQYGPLPYHKVEETIGQKYVVLPLTKVLESTGYLTLRKQGAKATNESAYTQLTLQRIDGVNVSLADSAGNNYSTQLENGRIPELIPLLELTASRQLLLNKTLWLNIGEIFIGYAKNHDPGAIPRENHRFEAVTVIDVILSGYDDSPLAIDVRLANGKTGYWFTSVSGTNTSLNPKDLFDHQFFTQDPKIKYHLTPKQWADVRANVVEVGMTMDEVVLIEGHPTRINTSQTAKGTTVQYVYGEEHPTYYYLTNGKVTSIQRSN